MRARIRASLRRITVTPAAGVANRLLFVPALAIRHADAHSRAADILSRRDAASTSVTLLLLLCCCGAP